MNGNCEEKKKFFRKEQNKIKIGMRSTWELKRGNIFKITILTL